MPALCARGVLSGLARRGALRARPSAPTRGVLPVQRCAWLSSDSSDRDGSDPKDVGDEEPSPAKVDVLDEADYAREAEKEGTLVKIDPENISTIPPVLAFPFPTRPLFPGVYQPCEVTNAALAAALLATKNSHHPYVGVFLPRSSEADASATAEFGPVTDPEQVHEIGVLAHITRLTQTPRGVQLLLLGGRRVRLGRVVEESPVMLVKVEEAVEEQPEEDTAEPSLAKAYSMEVMQTIKEILKLNPFFKEQMQMILERSEIHEAGKLADFGAALTTADAQSLQEVRRAAAAVAPPRPPREACAPSTTSRARPPHPRCLARST